MEKLITFAVPCYNSAAYMEHCVDTLLQGGGPYIRRYSRAARSRARAAMASML